MAPERTRQEGGYALLAAIVAIAAFGYLAFQVLAESQGNASLVAARLRQARLAAAADAGVGLALHGLGAKSRDARWPIDGQARRLSFAGADLTIVVEDERAKAPLGALSDNQARALFAGAGARGDRLQALVEEFRAWQSTAPAGTSDGLRHGPFRTVGELAALRDMTPDLLERIAPAVTVFAQDDGPFQSERASPLARTAMTGGVASSAEAAVAAPSIEGQSPTESIGPETGYLGRILTVRVVASDRTGARAHRREVVELTGDRDRPFWVRYAD